MVGAQVRGITTATTVFVGLIYSRMSSSDVAMISSVPFLNTPRIQEVRYVY